jgi:hypothetical protein
VTSEREAKLIEAAERAYRAAWAEAERAMRGGYPGSPTVDEAWYRYKRENFT